MSFSHSNKHCVPDIWLNCCGVSWLQGHHHQDGEADGRAGGLRHRHSGLAALPAEDHEPLPAGELGPGATGALTCLLRPSAARKEREEKSERTSVAADRGGNHSIRKHRKPQRLDRLQLWLWFECRLPLPGGIGWSTEWRRRRGQRARTRVAESTLTLGTQNEKQEISWAQMFPQSKLLGHFYLICINLCFGVLRQRPVWWWTLAHRSFCMQLPQLKMDIWTNSGLLAVDYNIKLIWFMNYVNN